MSGRTEPPGQTLLAGFARSRGYLKRGGHSPSAALDEALPAVALDDGLNALAATDPHEKHLLAMTFEGEKWGIYEISTSDRKCTFLLPATTFGALFARDGKPLLYQVASRSEVAIHRQPWKRG